ncbi:MAG: ATP-binding protein [Bacteroidota bacterium]
MAYNSYFVNVLGRLLLILLTLTGSAYLFVMQDRFFTLLFLILLSAVQVVLLFKYLNRTNRNLARFLLLLTQEDTSVVMWKDRVEKTFKGLHHSFNQVNAEISRIRLEKEKGEILLRGIIEHMDSGVLVAEDSGRIEVVNNAALKTLGVNRLDHMGDLERVGEGLSSRFLDLKYDAGNVIRSTSGKSGNSLLVRASRLQLEEQEFRIFSIQDIQSQLEANEIESWQKMTGVLSHEVSNSVTPISTLSDGISRKITRARPDKRGNLVVNKEAATDLLKSVELIRQRSNALVEFMEHYKSFSRLPDPAPGRINVSGFFKSLQLLFRKDLEKLGVSLEIEADASLEIQADRNLLEQAFINLVKNSIEALKDTRAGVISIRAQKQDKHWITIGVKDNGTGIPEEIQSQVFTPFFTTKPGGTGIGMSIVRKIVVMSGGSIRFDSSPGRGTEFVIKWPERQTNV